MESKEGKQQRRTSERRGLYLVISAGERPEVLLPQLNMDVGDDLALQATILGNIDVRLGVKKPFLAGQEVVRNMVFGAITNYACSTSHEDRRLTLGSSEW